MWVLVAFAIDVVIPFDLIYDNRGHVATIGIKEKQRWLPTQMLPQTCLVQRTPKGRWSAAGPDISVDGRKPIVSRLLISVLGTQLHRLSYLLKVWQLASPEQARNRLRGYIRHPPPWKTPRQRMFSS